MFERALPIEPNCTAVFLPTGKEVHVVRKLKPHEDVPVAGGLAERSRTWTVNPGENNCWLLQEYVPVENLNTGQFESHNLAAFAEEQFLLRLDGGADIADESQTSWDRILTDLPPHHVPGIVPLEKAPFVIWEEK